VARVITPSPVNDQIMVYDEAGRLIGEYRPSGTRLKEYVWLDDTLVAVLWTHSGSPHQYVLTDHLGTPRAIVNPTSNAILWRWDLSASAFGDHAAQQDPDGDGAAYTFNLRYPGQYFDVETGLHYNYFRDYDPGTGRYVQSDPIGLRGGINTFGYARAAPLSRIDPFGLADTTYTGWCRNNPGHCVGKEMLPNPARPDLPKHLAGGGVTAWLWCQITGCDPNQYSENESEEEARERGLPPSGLKPPIEGECEVGPASRPSEADVGGKSLWDPDGGEWRYFPGDRWHNPHWDHNPHNTNNSPWVNIPIGDLPPVKPSPSS
jgi:RHS repeat-associated protein